MRYDGWYKYSDKLIMNVVKSKDLHRVTIYRVMGEVQGISKTIIIIDKIPFTTEYVKHFDMDFYMELHNCGVCNSTFSIILKQVN